MGYLNKVIAIKIDFLTNIFYFCYRKLRKVITGRILKFFIEKSKKDVENYMKFYDDYGLFFREGIVTTTEQEERVRKIVSICFYKK